MAEQYLSEIRIFSFAFAPSGWALCNGQLLAINQNQALFSLLGTTYGGDGRVTFALPNLMGRTAMHVGNGHALGEVGGEESHTLSTVEMPVHVHQASADAKSGNATVFNPTNAYIANTTPVQMYSTNNNSLSPMWPQMIANAGGSQGHENRQPFLALNYCIALQGIFPSRN
jgi:microcystin-dependent protein